MAAVTGEYHHFIPQFILRNFAHKFVCPEPGCRPKKSPHKHVKGKHPGDSVVHHVNMESETYRLDESPVKRVCGQHDMYTDWAKPTTKEQRHIEDMFGRMESEASTIVQKIIKSHKNGDPGLGLTRDERNLLRKFIFILKYRGSTFHRRFYYEDAQDYDANDKQLLHDYMTKRGFRKPMDVWFHNLKTIMETKIDLDRITLFELKKKMYPSDAIWFISHAEMYYMAICTPDQADEEFVLTDNCYNVFEGPCTFKQSQATGQCVTSSNAPLHQFAPLSPKLMIVLRSNCLPNPEEDHDPYIRETRRDWQWSVLGEDFVPETSSFLADLPIRKASTSYSAYVDGAVCPRPGWDGILRRDDRFGFYFFRISSRHVRKLNGVLLDNAFTSRTIVFGSLERFVQTLGWFMNSRSRDFKSITGTEYDSKLSYLRSLDVLSKSLGVSKPAFWREVPTPVIPDTERYELKQTRFRQMTERHIYEPEENHEQNPIFRFHKTHSQFDDSRGISFDRDLRQSSEAFDKQVTLQFSLEVRDTDSLSMVQICESSNRRLCETMNPSAFWLYLKRLKLAHLGDNDGTTFMVELMSQVENGRGPEDVFSSLRPLPHKKALNCLMYVTVMNDLKKRMAPYEGVWPAGKFNMLHYASLANMRFEILELPGQIKHCGIPAIEDLAVREESTLLRQGVHRQRVLLDLILGDDDKLELLTRCRVKSSFTKALEDAMDSEELNILKTIFFDLTYPTLEWG